MCWTHSLWKRSHWWTTADRWPFQSRIQPSLSLIFQCVSSGPFMRGHAMAVHRADGVDNAVPLLVESDTDVGEPRELARVVPAV